MPRRLPRTLPRPTNTPKLTAYTNFRTLPDDGPEPAAAAHPLLDGDGDFVAEHLALVRSCSEYPRDTVRARRPPLQALVSSRDDAAAIHAAYRDHGYSMRQIATHLGCGVTTIHRRVRAHETANTHRHGTRKT